MSHYNFKKITVVPTAKVLPFACVYCVIGFRDYISVEVSNLNKSFCHAATETPNQWCFLDQVSHFNPTPNVLPFGTYSFFC